MIEADVSAVLALSLGRSVGAREHDWASMFAIARAERCAPLAWFRSADVIRASAPREIAGAWRAEAMAALDLAEFWRVLLVETLAVLRGADVSAIVLKGLPLSERLYGSIAARPSADIDLFISVPERAAAHRALLASGWRWRLGEAPEEGIYAIEREGRVALLEVHSALLDDGLVQHLSFAAPAAKEAALGESTVPMHDDDQLPGFLATHLAKHAIPPLLWIVDFHQLWSSLDEEARERALAAARSAGAHRYLKWASRRAELLVRAADGDRRALARLGFVAGGRRDAHNALRVAALAANLRDCARVISVWAVPIMQRGDREQLARLLLTRARKLTSRWRGHGRGYTRTVSAAGEPAGRALPVGRDEFDELIGDLTRERVSFWIRASGSSMHPAIASGNSVRLSPIVRPIGVDDVVLARAPGGGYVLHRVERLAGDWVHLRGDANISFDAPVPRSAICALADAISSNDGERRIPGARGARVVRWLRVKTGRAGGSHRHTVLERR